VSDFKLYDLAAQYRAIADLAASEADDAEVSAALDAITDQLAVKVDACLALVAEWGAYADALDAEAKRLADRRRVVDARAERLRAYVERNMRAAKVAKVEGERFTASLKKTPPALVIDEPADVPAKFKRVEEVISKEEIKRALKAGEFVPGVHLESKETLVIK